MFSLTGLLYSATNWGINNMSARMSCLHIFSQAQLLCLNNQLGGKQHGITVLKQSIGEVNNISARRSHLQLFSQARVTDFSYHGTTVFYSAYYILILVFPRKKLIKKDKKRQQRKELCSYTQADKKAYHH